MTQYEFENIASENGLQIINTTSERNGYPHDLKDAIIGFKTFDQAKELANKYGMSIEIFHKLDGWDLWHRTGILACCEFERDPEKLGEGYRFYTDRAEYFRNEVIPILQGIDDSYDYDSFEDLFLETKTICEELDMLKDDEVYVYQDGRFIDTIKLHAMRYEYDTHHYAIGLIAID